MLHMNFASGGGGQDGPGTENATVLYSSAIPVSPRSCTAMCREFPLSREVTEHKRGRHHQNSPQDQGTSAECLPASQSCFVH